MPCAYTLRALMRQYFDALATLCLSLRRLRRVPISKCSGLRPAPHRGRGAAEACQAGLHLFHGPSHLVITFHTWSWCRGHVGVWCVREGAARVSDPRLHNWSDFAGRPSPSRALHATCTPRSLRSTVDMAWLAADGLTCWGSGGEVSASERARSGGACMIYGRRSSGR